MKVTERKIFHDQNNTFCLIIDKRFLHATIFFIISLANFHGKFLDETYKFYRLDIMVMKNLK